MRLKSSQEVENVWRLQSFLFENLHARSTAVYLDLDASLERRYEVAVKKTQNSNNCVLSVQCLTASHFDSSRNRAQFSGRYNEWKKKWCHPFIIAATNYFAFCCFLPQDPVNNVKIQWKLPANRATRMMVYATNVPEIKISCSWWKKFCVL